MTRDDYLNDLSEATRQLIAYHLLASAHATLAESKTAVTASYHANEQRAAETGVQSLTRYLEKSRGNCGEFGVTMAEAKAVIGLTRDDMLGEVGGSLHLAAGSVIKF